MSTEERETVGPQAGGIAAEAGTLAPPSGSYKWKVLASVVVGLFMVILDATVVNVALRSLQEKYAVSTSDVQWVISLYTLALGITTPLSGFLGDRFGTKRIYLTGLALFVLGSALAGLAPSLPLLITARAVQGIGGGIALPLGSAMLFTAFPPNQRGVAYGVFGIVLVFAPASGPLLGGWLVDHGQLPWIFFINLPIGITGILVGSRLLRERRRPGRVPADLGGIILAPLAFGAILFAASTAGQQGAGWGDRRVLGAFALGLVALIALVIAEVRNPDPLLDLRLFRIRTFAIAAVVSVVGGVALFGAEFLLPLYLQVLRGKTAFEAGLFLLPLAIASGIVSPLAGRLTDRIGPRLPVVVGFLLVAFNTYQLSRLTLDTNLTFVAVLIALRGIGLALVIQNTQVAAVADVPMSRLTRATPLLSSSGQTIQSIGVAILATILSGAVTLKIPAQFANASPGDLSHVPPPLRAFVEAALRQFQQQYLTGLGHAYLAAFTISVAATVLALFLPGWPGRFQRRRPSEAPSAANTAGNTAANAPAVSA
jgi:DHA2 family multidrug resistance protein